MGVGTRYKLGWRWCTEVGLGRAGADRLAGCKVLMVHCTHCEDGGKALLSVEELKVLRNHRRQAEV